MKSELYKEKYKPLELKSLAKTSYTSIECPKCNCNIPAADLNIKDKLGVCSSCNVVFSFSDTVLDLESSTEKLKKPSSVEELKWSDGLEFCLTQPFPWYYALLLIILPFISIIFFGLYFAEGQGWALWPALGLFLFFLYSLYLSITFKQNKTYVQVNSTELSVESRPKNFKKDINIPLATIEQLYVNMSVHGISLNAIINEPAGQSHKLILGRFSSVLEAKYLEQEIEKKMGITDKKVPGELE